MSYKIGSFNTYNLSWGSNKNLYEIADIIREFDLIALQEVLSEGKSLFGPYVTPEKRSRTDKEYLQRLLGDKWDMCWLRPRDSGKMKSDGDSRGEGYAFLWRKDRFCCPRDSHGEEIRPTIIENYHIDDERGERHLVRDPGYGRFQLVALPTAEIRLITTHIYFGGENDEDIHIRNKEFEVLTRSIYPSVCDDHNDINCVVPYTIILGDYNLNLKESGLKKALMQPFAVIDGKGNIVCSDDPSIGGVYKLHTTQTDLTTLKQNVDGYSNNYDHFTYDEARIRMVKQPPHRMNVVEKKEDFKSYKEQISDHVPIVLELEF